jgi:hypothetical protein
VHSLHPGMVLTNGPRDNLGLDEESLIWDDVQLRGRFAV